MSSEKTKAEIPVLRLTQIKLTSLTYRVKNVNLITNIQSDIHLEGFFDLNLYGKRKNSFKIRVTQRIEGEAVLFRARHEARFTVDTPLSKEFFNNRDFHNKVMNVIVPFSSELFALLSSKTYVAPIITPGKVAFREATEK